MSPTLLFWPAFAQVILTFGVFIMMGRARSASIRARKQAIDDIALNRPGDWDEQATKVANNFKNHFELPVLFFAAIAVALALKIADPILVGLAWAFVAARVVQSYIHISPNKVMPRFLAYLTGAIVLLAMWVLLAIRVTAL